MKTFLVNQIKEKNVLGRSGLKKEGLALFWTASGIQLNVRAGELWLEAQADFSLMEPWISIWVNGIETSRLMLKSGVNNICVFRGMNPSIAKRVEIYKETQAMPEDKRHSLILKSFTTDGEFLPVKKLRKKIEFIGDSITSGEGAVGSHDETDWISMFFGGTKTYAFRLSKMLGAEPRMLSQSGWGVVTSYDNNPLHALPLYYEQICGVASGQLNEDFGCKDEYDFSSWKADYVVVNLGTNDQGAFNNPAFKDPNGNVYKMRLEIDGTPCQEDALYFETAVKEFLAVLRRKNPRAKIVWCYGMIGRLLLPQIKRAVSSYKKESGDKNVQFVLLPEIDYEKTAALNHPSMEQHQAAAEYLYKRIL